MSSREQEKHLGRGEGKEERAGRGGTSTGHKKELGKSLKGAEGHMQKYSWDQSGEGDPHRRKEKKRRKNRSRKKKWRDAWTSVSKKTSYSIDSGLLQLGRR